MSNTVEEGEKGEKDGRGGRGGCLQGPKRVWKTLRTGEELQGKVNAHRIIWLPETEPCPQKRLRKGRNIRK